jgi:[glutamine synthetase] adenylyltransferase / [glutamine synthetase]-adenylyl-L-tyrosine phosphorylase
VLNLRDEIQFRDPVRARPEIDHIEVLPAPALRLVKALLPLLPNPGDSVHFLNRLIEEAPEASQRFRDDATALRYALTIFSYSRFLSDAVIRYPEWLLEIAAAGDLHRGFLEEEYEARLMASLPSDGLPRAVDLALFRRRQILRIALRDILRFADLSETAEDLSNLADAILNVTWRDIRRELSQQPGSPAEGAFSVIALGKLGGKELNYSSDIDLLFVYSGAETSDVTAHATKEFFKRAANQMTEMLSTYTPEGMCYRVDLRLRPDGRLGEVCQSLEGAKRYYATRGRDWELQMLIKARVAAGDPRPGRELLEYTEPLIYRTTTDFRTVEAVSETRARIHEKQARREKDARPGKGNTVDVKLARGGIRDIEFLVQCLQRLYGGRERWVRHGGTLLALSRLRDKELLSSSEYSRLASAYQFMRHLEHRLQFDDDRQIHTLPRDKDQLDLLARKMPPVLAGGLAGLPSAGALERELDRHFSSVRDLYDRVIHSQRPIFYSGPEPAPAAPEDQAPAESKAEPVEAPERSEFPSVNLKRYLDLRAPAFCRLVSNGGILRSQDNMESFLDKVIENTEWLRMLEENEELALSVIDVFEHSQYFADQLVRHPELLSEMEKACGERQGRTGFEAPHEPVELRRFFREQMVRIQSDSVYHGVPVFKTLKRTSDLAGSVISAAYEIALADACATAPPAGDAYTPTNQLTVIALGRLGMREFDLASDADLTFVIPDADAAETLFWTGVAERIINVISSYTGDGVVFTIDTRLRPNGREGALVQTEGAYKEYFALHAEAWEGIAYMKARGVAGDVEHATAFLNELQQIDWRRYGQSGRSRAELSHMRARLEREQGGRNPLKAGSGGYYDIDFVLMYLRLRGAGLFFKVLNTPARIEVIEKMGHIDRGDAEFLTNTATFYRAVDHGMRVSTGHVEGRLPTNPAQIAILSELVQRWTPPGVLDGTLETVTKRIRRDTRAFYQRIFGPA